MKIAYLIQCHKNFEQIKLLLEVLKLTKVDYVVIHVDAKNKKLREHLNSFYYDVPNVKVLDEPIYVHWSGVSQIYATLKMIKFLYMHSIEFDYCSLLSGEDVVLNVDKLKKYLSLNKGKSFLEFRQDRAKYVWRINRFNLFRDNIFSQNFICRGISSIIIRFQLLFRIKRNNFKENDIYLGSQWFTISKTHMDVINDFLDEDFIKRFKFTSCCDEHFFQTLFKKLIDEKYYEKFNLRYLTFSGNSNSPEYLSLNQLKDISLMNDVFFARKVSYETLLKYSTICENHQDY